jgi:hypothetical protein
MERWEVHTRFWSQNLKRTPGIPRPRREDIRKAVRKTGWEGADWMHLVQYMDRGELL